MDQSKEIVEMNLRKLRCAILGHGPVITSQRTNNVPTHDVRCVNCGVELTGRFEYDE